MTKEYFLVLTTLICLNTSNISFGQESQCAVVTITNGKSSLTTLDGKAINSEFYLEIGPQREGYWSARKIIGEDTLGGFINSNGQEHSFIFKNTFNFSEGHAVVQLRNGKYSLVNSSFKKITDVEFEFLLDLREGFAPAKINGKWTFLKPNGELLAEPKYDDVFWFKNGFCSVEINGLHGYINKQGNLITEVKYKNWREFKEDGLAFVSDSALGWTVIDTLGNYVFKNKNFLFDGVSFNEFGLVKIYQKVGENQFKYGYTDRNGEVKVPIIYDRIESFFNHPVTGAGTLESNGQYKYVLIDTAGNQMGQTKFDHIHYYYGGGVSMVTTTYYNSKPIDLTINLDDTELNYELLTGKMGVIDTLGNLIIPVLYNKLSPEYSYFEDDHFDNQCLFEAQKVKDGPTGVLNDKGDVLVPFMYTFISINYLGNGLFYGEKSKSASSIYDSKTRSEFELDELNFDKKIRMDCYAPLFVFLNVSNNKKGLKNSELNSWLIQPIYDDIVISNKNNNLWNLKKN